MRKVKIPLILPLCIAKTYSTSLSAKGNFSCTSFAKNCTEKKAFFAKIERLSKAQPYSICSFSDRLGGSQISA